MKVRPISCDRFPLSRFLSGELSEAELQEVETHLSCCSQCRQRLEEHTAPHDEWQELRELLSDDATSGHFPSLAANDELEACRRLLGPTDDPRMMGRIATYEVVGFLGRGGMGIVFKAFDPSLNRYVAIKMLAPMLLSSGVFKQRFLREAQSAAAVVHDNVVGIHAISEWQGIPYLVMTFVRGQSLQSRLTSRGHLSLREVLRIGMQIASGLAAAHAQGLIHRDIKPANILLESDVDRVIITDFGIARAIDDLGFTRSNTLLGTPEYMSPEQARDESLDFRTDLFSLGCVLYEASTGKSPFRSSTSYGAIRKVIELSPPSIRTLVPDLPEWFAKFVGRLLKKDRNSRFESAAEVSTLLTQCLAHLEQPQVAPFPKTLSQSTPRRFSAVLLRRPIMTVSWIVMAVLGSSALLLHMGQSDPTTQPGNRDEETQVARSSDPAMKTPARPDEEKLEEGKTVPLTANAGKYVLKLQRADAIDQTKLGMKPTNQAANLLLDTLQNGSTQQATDGFQTNQQSFGSSGGAGGFAGGAASGGAGGFAGGSVSTSSSGGVSGTSGGGVSTGGSNSSFVRPNLALAFEVDSREKAILELDNLDASDDQGKPVLWMGRSAFNFYDPAFEKDARGAMIAYFQEENDTEHVSVTGELKVTPGRVVEIEFPGGKRATKKSGEHAFVLTDVQKNDGGIHVSLALPQLGKVRGNVLGNPQAMMKAMLEQQGAFEVSIVDNEGELHYPNGSAGGSAGGSASGFSSSSGFGQNSQSNASQTYSFAPLADRREIKSIIVRTMERTGKPRSYPFKFSQIPIPYGKK